MISTKLDYNKIMYIIALIFILCFCVFVIKDYENYNTTENSAPFYTIVAVRILEFVLLSAILLYLYNQNTYVKATYYTVKSNKFSDDFSEYKIAHISDFHNTNSKRIKKNLVKKMEENSPDIIVITGDLIDSRRTNIQTAKEFVESIVHIAPIYYVLGNHESRKENIAEFEKILQESGAIILRNQKVKLNKKEEVIELIGLDDPDFYTNATSIEEIKVKLEEKISTLVDDENKFAILLIHRPEYLEVYSNNNLDLVFTGHAHGGQIRIPFIGGIVAPGQGFFPKYTKGIHQVNETKTVISRGIGNSRFPFRVNNRPEIIFVDLKKDKN